MTQADKLDRTALSSSLPGTWLLESRIDVTASGESRVEPSLDAINAYAAMMGTLSW